MQCASGRTSTQPPTQPMQLCAQSPEPSCFAGAIDCTSSETEFDVFDWGFARCPWKMAGLTHCISIGKNCFESEFRASLPKTPEP